MQHGHAIEQLVDPGRCGRGRDAGRGRVVGPGSQGRAHSHGLHAHAADRVVGHRARCIWSRSQERLRRPRPPGTHGVLRGVGERLGCIHAVRARRRDLGERVRWRGRQVRRCDPALHIQGYLRRAGGVAVDRDGPIGADRDHDGVGDELVGFEVEAGGRGPLVPARVGGEVSIRATSHRDQVTDHGLHASRRDGALAQDWNRDRGGAADRRQRKDPEGRDRHDAEVVARSAGGDQTLDINDHVHRAVVGVNQEATVRGQRDQGQVRGDRAGHVDRLDWRRGTGGIENQGSRDAGPWNHSHIGPDGRDPGRRQAVGAEDWNLGGFPDRQGRVVATVGGPGVKDPVRLHRAHGAGCRGRTRRHPAGDVHDHMDAGREAEDGDGTVAAQGDQELVGHHGVGIKVDVGGRRPRLAGGPDSQVAAARTRNHGEIGQDCGNAKAGHCALAEDRERVALAGRERAIVPPGAGSGVQDPGRRDGFHAGDCRGRRCGRGGEGDTDNGSDASERREEADPPATGPVHMIPLWLGLAARR